MLRTGVALRRGFEPRPYSFAGGTLKVLVLGGSQGAKSLNETVPVALSRAKTPLTVMHQAGKGRDELVRQHYESLGARTQVEVVPFITDMPAQIASADLIVGRSGAGAVSEICAIGRPSLLIPYPFASGDHQYKNALSLQEAGAAVCVRSADASVERLVSELDGLAADPERLVRMARAAENLGRPDAAEVVAYDLLDLGNVHFDDFDDGDSASEALDGGSTPAPSEVH